MQWIEMVIFFLINFILFSYWLNPSQTREPPNGIGLPLNPSGLDSAYLVFNQSPDTGWISITTFSDGFSSDRCRRQEATYATPHRTPLEAKCGLAG